MARHDRRGHRPRQRGQTLVEFSLVIPIFLVLIMGIAEFAFAVSAVTSTSFASRDAVLLASELTTDQYADCVVMRQITQDVTAPAELARITQVDIFKSDPWGAIIATDTWKPGTHNCQDSQGNKFTVPFTPTATGYPPSDRCANLNGINCPKSTQLDMIGVRIQYQYQWKTPLAAFLKWTGQGPLLIQTNTMYLEPNE